MADGDQAKGGRRRRKNKGQVAASLGGTTFTGQPARTVVEFNATYFQSSEYQSFEADLRRECQARGITVQDIEQVMGIWQGELEPAVVVQLRGDEENIVAIAVQLGAKYKQYAMLIVIPDRQAMQYSYTIKDITQEEAEDAILAMQHYGVQGGRYVDGRLEIADVDGSLATSILKLADALRKPLTKVRARVRLLSGDAPGKAEGKDYEWTSER
jgi:hypothetical protein